MLRNGKMNAPIFLSLEELNNILDLYPSEFKESYLEISSRFSDSEHLIHIHEDYKTIIESDKNCAKIEFKTPPLNQAYDYNQVLAILKMKAFW